MSRSKSSHSLPDRVRSRLEERSERGCLTDDDLDWVLLALDAEHFEEQLQQVVIELGTTPLLPGSPPTSSSPAGRVRLPPVGSLLSRRYLQDVQRYPAMTREEELAASRRMEFAQARVDAAEFRPLAVRLDRIAELSRIRTGFVQRNLHIVVSEVYSYRSYDRHLDDLIQEGNAALLRAVEKFDWRHGVRFRTYVAWWVRQAVERSLASRKGAVRVPHHLQQKFRRLQREGKLPRGSDAELTVDQVARAFGIDRDAAGHLLEASRPSFSIDQKVGSEGASFRDFLLEDWEPVDGEQDQRLRHRLGDLLRGLDDREQVVLRLRFGLDGRPRRTLEEVGRVLHLSRERSRQIQQRALSKLRDQAAGTRLEDFL